MAYDEEKQGGSTRRLWVFKGIHGEELGRSGPFANFDQALSYAEHVLEALGERPMTVAFCDTDTRYPEDAAVMGKSQISTSQSYLSKWMRKANQTPAWGGSGP